MKHEGYPKVSAVISTYNRSEMLDRALASVYAQTFDDFEVIIVDDCSPHKDSTLSAEQQAIQFPPEYISVLEKWGEKFAERGVDIFAYRLGENSGYHCMPKNKGIEQARGDYIAYLDDDNEWHPGHLEACVRGIESDFSTDMVYTRLRYCGDPEMVEECNKHLAGGKIPLGDAPGTEWNPQLLGEKNYIDTNVIMHSKGAFWRMVRDSGFGWDETLRRFGDWNFVWRWATFGNTAKLIDEVTVNYYWHPNQLQLTRPCIEVPVCLNYTQYQSLRVQRNQELLSASSPVRAASTTLAAPSNA